MKKITVAICFLALFSNLSHALMPENGWWWNPNASGSGYNIEIQDNVIAVSAYVFDDAGAPIYYISAGPMTSDRSYTGSLDLVTGGQCINCPYRQPTRSSVGTVKVDFTSSSTGYIAFNNGTSIPIQRLGYTIDTNSVYGLLGEWMLVMSEKASILNNSTGERVQFKYIEKQSNLDGTLIAKGNQSSVSLEVMAKKVGDSYYILSKNSVYSWYTYTFTFFGVNRIEGMAWRYKPDSAPIGDGVPFIGFRTQSANFVNTNIGPGFEAVKY